MTLGEYLGAGTSITKALYHLEGNSNDSSGNARNGTDTAITYGLGNGKFGQGASFNGTTSKITVPSGARVVGESSFTTIHWYKSGATGARTLYSEGSTGGSTPFYTVDINAAADGNVRFFIRDNSSISATVNVGANSNDNFWHCVIVVKESASSWKLYFDGFILGTDTTTIGALTINVSTIGALVRNTSSQFYSGALDETILEVGAWDASKIRKYYTWAKGRFIV